MPETYLTTAQVAERLQLTPKSLRNKVAAGLFREGEHFFRKRGLGPRWVWERIVAWVEEKTPGRARAEIVPSAEPQGRHARPRRRTSDKKR